MTSNLYVKLDASYDDDPKILRAGEKAEVLYVRSLCLVKRILSDGFVADEHLPRFGLSAVNARAKKLVEVGLWERVDGGYLIASWLKHNSSKDEVEAIKEGGARGNHVRWHVRGGKPKGDCEFCVGSGLASPSGGESPAESGGESGGRIPEAEAEAEADKPLAPDKPARPRDPVFESLVEICGLDMAELTKSARGAINRASKELREIGATPEGIRARASVHRKRWPNAELTATSLAKNYAQLGARGSGSSVGGEAFAAMGDR